MRYTRATFLYSTLWLLLFSFVKTSASQPTFNKIKTFNAANGLTSNSVNGLLSDDEGYVWVATNFGLLKYDGYEFDVFKNDLNDSLSLPDNVVKSLCQDYKKRLWVITAKGVCLLDRRTRAFTPVKVSGFGGEEVEVTGVVGSVVDKMVWFSVEGRGLFYYDDFRKEVKPLKRLKNSSEALSRMTINSMLPDPSGGLWLVSKESGLSRLDLKNDKLVRFNPGNNGWSNAIVRGVFATGGCLYLASHNALYALNKNRKTFETIELPGDLAPGTRIEALAADSSSDVYVGISGVGVYSYSPATKAFSHLNVVGNKDSLKLTGRVSLLYVDKGQNLWVAYRHRGLSVVYPYDSRISFHPVAVGTSESIRFSCVSRGEDSSLWFGSENAGLCRYNMGTRFLETYKFTTGEDYDEPVTAVLSLGGGSSVLLGVKDKGVLRFNTQTRRFVPFLDKIPGLKTAFVSFLVSDDGRTVWIGTLASGLFTYDVESGSVSKIALDSAVVANTQFWTMIRDKTGNVWLGANKKIIEIDAATLKVMKVKSLPDSADPSENNVRALCFDAQGFLWIGTSRKMYKYDARRDKIDDLSPNDDLFRKPVHCLFPSGGGGVWAVFANQIASVNTSTLKLRLFTSAHGIDEEEFLVAPPLIAGGDDVLLAGISGLTTVNPGYLSSLTPRATRISITDVRLANQSLSDYHNPGYMDRLSVDDHGNVSLSVDYSDNSLEIGFSALEMGMSDAIRYRYKIDGIDKDWITVDASKRLVLYTGLPRGKNVFRVQASNTLGEWQDGEKVIELDVHAPFWRGGWFYLMVFLCVAGLITLFYLQRLSNLTRIRTLLERQVEQRTRLLEKQKQEIEFQKAEVRDQRDIANFQKREIEEQKQKLSKQKEELEKSQAALEEVLQYRKVVLDEAKQKAVQYEKTLSRSINQFKALAESIPELVFRMKLPDETFEYVNPSCLSITGYSHEEFMANHSLYRVMIADEFREYFSEQRKRLGRGQVDADSEYKIKTKSGAEKWVRQVSTLFFSETGVPECIQSVISDITASKNAADGDKLAKERSGDALKLKSAILEKVSHDIRGPKASIVGFADLLNDPSLTHDEKRAFAANITSSGDSLLHMIDDIIDLSKIEAGQLELNLSRCFINQLLTDIHKSFNAVRLSQGSAVDLRIQLPLEDDNFSILTDTHRFKQVMMNLVGNALKYTPEGYVEFGYEVSQQDDSDDITSLLFYVKDTGVGMTREMQDTIFNYSKVLADFQENKTFGAGVGLSLTWKLVELLGGTISLESVPGEGTTFKLVIPVDSELNARSEIARKETDAINWSSKVLLIAEDEDNNYRFIQAALSKTKATLLRARDGEQAVELVKEKKKEIDLILMDMQMPKLNGYDATKIIKKMERNLPIVAQTAFAMAGQKIKCFESGCDGYISKPYKAKELVEVIGKHLL